MFSPTPSFSVPSWLRLAIFLALVANLTSPLPAQAQADGAAAAGQAADAVRPELGKPLQAVQDLLKAGKGQDALTRLREVETVAPAASRSPYESYIIERLRGAAATLSGDAELAARAFDAVLASGRLPAGERTKVIEAVAGNFYRARNFQ